MRTSPTGYRSILVPLDGSPLAEQALPLAEAIAEQARGKLKLVMVHEPLIVMEPGPAYTQVELAILRADRQYLKSVTARLRERLGGAVSCAVLRGIPAAQTLATYARELGVDLIVMTTHGRGGVCRAWLGSVTDHLIRTGDVPVLAVRPEGEGASRPIAPVSEIMVPLDGSPLAEAALAPAIRLARLWDAEISLVQVVRPVLSAGRHPDFVVGYSEQATAIQRDLAQDYIRDVAERIREAGVRSSGVAVVARRAPETLISLASPDRVSLIVVATHGRGGMKRVVLGGLADKLVRGANVPVLVIRPSGRRARRKSGEIVAVENCGAECPRRESNSHEVALGGF